MNYSYQNITVCDICVTSDFYCIAAIQEQCIPHNIHNYHAAKYANIEFVLFWKHNRIQSGSKTHLN